MARADARSLVRGARLWLLAATAVGAGMAAFLHLSIGHYAAHDPNSVPPRFLAHGIGTVVLAVLLVGVVLLGSDAGARHRREGIAEALHCRPCSNLALVAGRCIALVFVGWMVTAAYSALAQTAGLVGGYRGGAALALEPWSLAKFTFVDAPAALAFWGALTIALTVACGHRLGAAIALAALGVQGWALFHTPFGLLELVSTVGQVADIASDIVPRLADAPALAQRFALIVVAVGLLWMAAAAYRRPDATGRRLALSGGLCLIASGLACGFALAEETRAEWRERDQWAAIHKSRRNEPRADLERIAGRVAIAPGERLELDVDLHLRRPPDEPADQAVLSLNPGLAVRQVLVAGRKAAFHQANGLLTVTLPGNDVVAGENLRLTVRAAGVPDERFAYLDDVVEAGRRSLAESRLHVLGTEAALFERGYVALMPSTRWLPMPGANYPADGSPSPEDDFFHLDLEVGIPSGWLAVGPGRGEPAPTAPSSSALANDPSSRTAAGSWFRYRPPVPVAQAALFAAPFARRSTRIGDVEFAIFLHPRHMANFRALDGDALADLKASLAFALRIAGQNGMPYPFDVFNLVEAPGRLRAYGGGPLRATTALPNVALLREHAIATAGNWDWSGDGHPGGLRGYFDRDVMGGNPFAAAHRHLFGFQAQARGNPAFHMLMEQISRNVINPWFGGGEQRFLAHSFAFAESWPALGAIVADTAPIRRATLRGAADEWAESVPLTDAAPWSRPRSLAAFARKADALGRQLVAEMGPGASIALLAELRRRFPSATFRVEDAQTVARSQGAQANIARYLQAKQLPGFLFSHPRAFRLPDDERGLPRYQVTLRVHNAEPAFGLVRLRYHADTHRPDFPFFGDPTPVAGCAALELGMLAAVPPTGISVEPFYSLNRKRVFLQMPDFDIHKTVETEPFVGARPVGWQETRDAGIVVDDLEAQFATADEALSLVDALARRWRTLTAANEPLDAGIPILSRGRPERRWYRAETPWSWGRYRHTLAWTPAGDGGKSAVFATTIPAGRWHLDYHLPARAFTGMFAPRGGLDQGRLGTFDIQVRGGERRLAAPFDADAAEAGWNRVGEFELRSGPVRVYISNRTSGQRVIADAIRWRPANAEARAGLAAHRAEEDASRARREARRNTSLPPQTKGADTCFTPA